MCAPAEHEALVITLINPRKQPSTIKYVVTYFSITLFCLRNNTGRKFQMAPMPFKCLIISYFQCDRLSLPTLIFSDFNDLILIHVSLNFVL